MVRPSDVSVILQALILPAVGISIWGFVMSRPAVFAAVFGGHMAVPARFFDHSRETLQCLRPSGQGVSCIFKFNQWTFYGIFWRYWRWLYIEFSKVSSSLSPLYLLFGAIVDGIWKMVKTGPQHPFLWQLGTGLEVIEATQYGAGTSSFGKFSGDPQRSSRFGVKKDALFEWELIV